MNHGTITLSNQQWLGKFQLYLQRRFPDRSTSIHYPSDLRQFMATCSIPFLDVTSEHIEHFIQLQHQKGCVATTCRRRIAALNSFFSFAQDNLPDHSFTNPVITKRHAPKIPDTLPRDLTDQQVQCLFDSTTELRLTAMLSVMLFGGLRIGELLDLKVDDIQMSDDRSPVRLRVMGKGRKERIALVTPQTYQVVLAYLNSQTSPHPQGFIFLNHRVQQLSVNGAQGLFRQLSKQSGVPVTSHQLRHTFATRLVRADMPLLSLSRLLGHSLLQTTQRYIRTADPRLAREYQQAMQVTDLLSETGPQMTDSSETSLALAQVGEVTVQHPNVTSFQPPQKLDQAPEWLQKLCLDWVKSRWLDWKETRRQSNGSRVLHEVLNFFLWQVTNRELSCVEELTNEAIEEFVDASRERGLTARGINSTLTVVYNLLNYCCDRGFLTKVPNRPKLKMAQTLPQHLSQQEWKLLEEHVQQMEGDEKEEVKKLLFYLMGHGGLRQCEVLDLKVGEVDLEAGRIRVVGGKGNKDRVVFLSTQGCQAVKEYLNKRNVVDGDLLLHVKGKGLNRGQVREWMSELGQRVGIKLSARRLRHSYATRLLNHGMTLEVLQQLMGHEKIKTTLIYAKLADQTIERQYREVFMNDEA